jgi:KipI family sensor histidine kinase inhibitor
MLEVDDVEQAAQLAIHLRSLDLPGVREIVPAARTVLIECSDGAARLAVVEAAPNLDLRSAASVGGALIEVPTAYDGPDLDDVAAHAGLSVDEVIARHSGTEYRAAFCGFVPGFAYLTGLPVVLQLPRRSEPRPRVAAGSVAIGAEFTGVYPSASPGGWHVIGHTDEAMWDAARERPSFIVPGDRVRFVPVRR